MTRVSAMSAAAMEKLRCWAGAGAAGRWGASGRRWPHHAKKLGRNRVGAPLAGGKAGPVLGVVDQLVGLSAVAARDTSRLHQEAVEGHGPCGDDRALHRPKERMHLTRRYGAPRLIASDRPRRSCCSAAFASRDWSGWPSGKASACCLRYQPKPRSGVETHCAARQRRRRMRRQCGLTIYAIEVEPVTVELLVAGGLLAREDVAIGTRSPSRSETLHRGRLENEPVADNRSPRREGAAPARRGPKYFSAIAARVRDMGYYSGPDKTSHRGTTGK